MSHQSRESRKLHPLLTVGVALIGVLLLGAASSMFVLHNGPLVVLFLELAIGLTAIVLLGAVLARLLSSVSKARREGQDDTGEP